MNGRERILAMLEGRPADQLPLMPITMMFAGDHAGVKYGAYASDYRVLAEAQTATARDYQFDYVSAISDPSREAADCGADVQYFENQPPAINEANALLGDKSVLDKLEIPDPLSAGRMRDRVRGVELLKEKTGGDKLVEGWIEGPCAESADLRGINTLMLDFYDDPDFVRRMFDFVLEMELHFAKAQIDAGADLMELGVPFSFHVDVSGSAIGEHTWGASKGIDPSLYLTVGTGIGGGYLLNGKPLTGLTAVEMGHIRIPHDMQKDPFEGSCPYHKDCFEGLAAGPALMARFGARGETLPDDDPFWLVEAAYIASALTNYILTLSPRIIVLGGGIMQRGFLYPLIRRRVRELLNGYVTAQEILSNIDRYIVPPSLGKYSGVLGAIAMAMALDSSSS